MVISLMLISHQSVPSNPPKKEEETFWLIEERWNPFKVSFIWVGAQFKSRWSVSARWAPGGGGGGSSSTTHSALGLFSSQIRLFCCFGFFEDLKTKNETKMVQR